MMLLRLISWPYARAHVLRTLLTVAGISLGVGVFVGMNVANGSVTRAFTQTIDRIAGKTELQITAGESGFPEDVLERVQALPAVRIAVPAIEAVADTRIRGEGSLLVLGIDLTGDRSLREYDLESAEDAVIEDPLVFLAQPDSIMLSRTFAEQSGLAVGDQITLGTIAGDRRFTVRGIMRSGGLASAFGGNLAVMDVYAAQAMFGRGRTFDRIDLALSPGVPIGEGVRQIEAALGAGYAVAPPSARGRQFESMIAGYSLMMQASSLFAVVIGMFIIYNTFATAVTERRKEIGILRALGATQSQIRRLFIGEAIVGGLIGSLAGLAIGMLIARGIAVSIAGLLHDLFGAARDPGEPGASLWLMALGVMAGIVTSIVAALVPARAAARVDPVRALQKGTYQFTPGRSRLRLAVSAGAIVAAAGCLLLGTSRGWLYAGYLLAIVSALLLTPFLSTALVRVLRPVLQRIRPVEGALAADSLLQAPARTSASVAALMLSVALVVAFGGMSRSTFESLVDWMDTALDPDLFLMPSQDISIRTVRFPASMTAEVAAVPGVRAVQTIRQTRVPLGRANVMLIAMELGQVGETTRVRVTAGQRSTMFREAAAGRGLVVSDNLAQLQRLAIGDVLTLPAPRGVLRLPIVGTIMDYSDQQGAVLVDRQLFQRYWGDDSVNFYRVYLAAGTDAAVAKRRILEKYAGQRRVFVLDNAELRDYIFRIATSWFALTYLQVGIAMVIAVLGIVNVLTVSITDRRRELGVLRAVGALDAQVRRTIWMEALSTATVGLVLGLALGAVTLVFALEAVRQDVAGMRLDFRYPFAVAAATVPTLLAAALLGALGPARSATRSSLVEALEYE